MPPSNPARPMAPDAKARGAGKRPLGPKALMAQRRARLEKHGRTRYAAGLLDGIAAMLSPGDVVCDCGANVGLVTAVLAASGATVHCFEPDPHAFAILTGRFAEVPNVILHQAAVGEADGEVTFYRSDEFDDDPNKSRQGATMYAEHRFVQRTTPIEISVKVIDFTAFLTDLLDSGKSVPFVKIDVEGAELGILRRMLDLRLFDRIKLTVAETHEAIIPDWAESYAALRSDIGASYPKSRVNLDWI